MAWTTTPLYPGPLGSDAYSYNIEGLTANTKYIYRAYFIVSGVTYYGNILTGTTAAISIVPPTVVTGLNNPPLETSVLVIANQITDDGGAPVVEKGLLYTQLGFWGTDSNLIYSNVPTYVKKVSGTTTGTGSTFSAIATGLTPSTTVYYRAFAKTAAGVGYGDIDTVVTASPPPPPSVTMLYIYGAENNGVQDACNAGELSPQGGYSVTLGWKFYKGEASGSPETMSVQVYCNGYLKHSITCTCKAISSSWAASSGTFPSFNVGSGDDVVVCACANILHTATLGNCATGRIVSVTSPYVVGSLNCTTAYTCGTFAAPLPFLLA